MQATNVKLSATEMALACDTEMLLTKNRIIRKVYELFGELAENYITETKNHQLPTRILQSSPKISRGENYLGLPWVVLDYPRYFKEDGFFSIRTFFWWGKYFSMAFLVKGEWLKLVDVENLIKFQEKDCFVSTVNDPWQHHISPENTLQLNGWNATDIQILLDENGFLKLQVKIDIQNWDNVQGFMEEAFRDFMKIANN